MSERNGTLPREKKEGSVSLLGRVVRGAAFVAILGMLVALGIVLAMMAFGASTEAIETGRNVLGITLAVAVALALTSVQFWPPEVGDRARKDPLDPINTKGVP